MSNKTDDHVDLKSICTKVIGIGKNYKEPGQKIEGHIPDPLIFSKFPNCIITDGAIKLPHGWEKILHEVELGVVISKHGKFITEEDAMDYVLGYVLALDMTINLELDKYPILLLKSFDTSCPISEFIDKSKIPDPDNVDLKLSVNGEPRHDGNTRDLIRKIPKLISYLSKYFTLERGDLILTGTPSPLNGINSVKSGDVLEASLGNLTKIKFTVE